MKYWVFYIAGMVVGGVVGATVVSALGWTDWEAQR